MEETIKKFVQKYDVKFPIFGKIDVNGVNRHELWKHLCTTGDHGMEKITTNFAKFLVSSSTGSVLGGYLPKLEPNTLIPDIEKFLE